MPDEYELPDEPDPNEKIIKELQQQVLELQNQKPALSLKFDNSSDRLSFKVAQPKLLSEDEINQQLEHIKNRFPKMESGRKESVTERDPNKPKGGVDIKDIQRLYAASVGGYSEADIGEYNSKLDQFFVSFEKYLNQKAKYDFQNALTIKLNIVVINSGTAPAEDLDIYLHFPDGFELSDKLLDSPSEPRPPTRPLTVIEKLASNRSVFQDIFNRAYIPPPNLSKLNAAPPNVSSPKIRRTKSYDVQIKVRRIKHNQPVSLKPLYLTFDTYESAKSFNIQFRLNAANIPREVNGFLNVIIDKPS
jgi:hypothetical protein